MCSTEPAPTLLTAQRGGDGYWRESIARGDGADAGGMRNETCGPTNAAITFSTQCSIYSSSPAWENPTGQSIPVTIYSFSARRTEPSPTTSADLAAAGAAALGANSGDGVKGVVPWLTAYGLAFPLYAARMNSIDGPINSGFQYVKCGSKHTPDVHTYWPPSVINHTSRQGQLT
jgi:hypothetical protein